ncbi:MAG: hypothetical protein AAF581_08670 [Planctomycetota bacterium]
MYSIVQAQRPRLAVLLFVAVVLAMLAMPAVHADPPTCPPPCNVDLDPLFCIRVTDIQRSLVDQDRWFLQLEFINWTGAHAAGISISLNAGTALPGATLPAGTPRFAGAMIDSNGRPFGPASHRPRGNQPRPNLWQVELQSSTRIDFAAPQLPTVPMLAQETLLQSVAAQVGNRTFNGVLDTDFINATTADCATALTLLIPGSFANFQTTPVRIEIPDIETVDDGPNALDGFVLIIDDFEPGETLSFNWFMIDELGSIMGMIANNGPVLGDEYAFGTFNVACGDHPAQLDTMFRTSGVTVAHTSTGIAYVSAPAPIFVGNAGFDPADNTDPNADSPRYFAEDELNSVDMYPFMPIPAGRPGAGTYFHVEPGAAVTAEFVKGGDNVFVMNGTPVQSGVNILPLYPDIFMRGDCNNDGAKNIADPVRLLNYLFPQSGGIPALLNCDSACDGNDDNSLNIADAVAMLSVLFPSGAPIPWLPPDLCGFDPTPDSIDCLGFSGCP